MDSLQRSAAWELALLLLNREALLTPKGHASCDRCPGDPKKWPKMRRCFPFFFCLMVYLYTYLYRSIQYLYYVYTPIKMFSSDRTYAKKDIWKDGAWKQIISGDLKPSNRSNCVMIQVCPLHPLLSGQWDFTVSWQTVCYLLPHEPFIRRNPAPVDRW